jgi:hypothetical protein
MNTIRFNLKIDERPLGSVVVDQHGEAQIFVEWNIRLVGERHAAIAKAASEFAAWIRRHGNAGGVSGATFEEGVHLDIA